MLRDLPAGHDVYNTVFFIYRKKERNGIREGWRPKDRNQRLSSRVWLECARQGKRKGLFRDIIQINCAGGYGNSFDQKPFFLSSASGIASLVLHIVGKRIDDRRQPKLAVHSLMNPLIVRRRHI